MKTLVNPDSAGRKSPAPNRQRRQHYVEMREQLASEEPMECPSVRTVGPTACRGPRGRIAHVVTVRLQRLRRPCARVLAAPPSPLRPRWLRSQIARSRQRRHSIPNRRSLAARRSSLAHHLRPWKRRYRVRSLGPAITARAATSLGRCDPGACFASGAATSPIVRTSSPGANQHFRAPRGRRYIGLSTPGRTARRRIHARNTREQITPTATVEVGERDLVAGDIGPVDPPRGGVIRHPLRRVHCRSGRDQIPAAAAVKIREGDLVADDVGSVDAVRRRRRRRRRRRGRRDQPHTHHPDPNHRPQSPTPRACPALRPHAAQNPTARRQPTSRAARPQRLRAHTDHQSMI